MRPHGAAFCVSDSLFDLRADLFLEGQKVFGVFGVLLERERLCALFANQRLYELAPRKLFKQLQRTQVVQAFALHFAANGGEGAPSSPG